MIEFIIVSLLTGVGAFFLSRNILPQNDPLEVFVPLSFAIAIAMNDNSVIHQIAHFIFGNQREFTVYMISFVCFLAISAAGFGSHKMLKS